MSASSATKIRRRLAGLSFLVCSTAECFSRGVVSLFRETFSARGRRNQNREPPGARVSAPIVPPQRSTVILQKYNPRPAFPECDLPLENNANSGESG